MTVIPPMYPLLGLMGALCILILGVACGNLGGLLLARGVARQREIAIRIAVGAGRGRLIRQLFTESLLLALLGSMAGLGLGYLVLQGLVLRAGAPSWLDPTPDWRVVVFTIGIGFAAATLFGLTPALQIARQRNRATVLRQLLIGAQVAASCVLLIVAGLLVRALNRATSVDPGFDYQQVISIDPGIYTYSPANAQTYVDSLESRLRNLPGIESVAMATNPPLGNRWSMLKTNVGGRSIVIHFNNVDPSFFQTMKIPIVRGRNLIPGDSDGIIVSESLARLEWPSEDPVGKSYKMGVDKTGADINRVVVGVSGSARLISPENSDAVEIYQLAAPSMLSSMVLLVRTSAAPEGILPTVASIAKGIDPKVFPEVHLMKTAYREKVQTAEYSALAVSVLGFVALLLACVGIVGLVSYAVSQRTREIGIRMALAPGLRMS